VATIYNIGAANYWEDEFSKAMRGVIQKLIKLLAHETVGVCSSAVNLLGELGRRGECPPYKIYTPLTECEGHFRGTMGLAIPMLIKLLEHKDSGVLSSVASLLTEMAGHCE
jgi:hypothetical protein